MGRIVEQTPVKRPRLAPLPPLCELLAHEKQLLARIAPHEGVIGAQGSEFLPVVARHLGKQGAFSVHDLVMGQGQHEIFTECIDETECDLVMMMLSKYRL